MNQAELAGMIDAFDKVAARTMIRRGGRKHVPMPDLESKGKEIAGKARHEVKRIHERSNMQEWVMDEAKKRLHQLSHSMPEGDYHIPVKKRGVHVGHVVGNIVGKGKAIAKSFRDVAKGVRKGSQRLGPLHVKHSNLQNEIIGDYEICWSEMEKESMVGLGVEVARKGNFGINVGLPHLVGAHYRLGEGEWAPHLGLGLTGPHIGISHRSQKKKKKKKDAKR